MADQVKFKRGTQASLNSLLLLNGTAGSFDTGAFYLTSDTDRLYFAQSSSELVPLNQFIRSVADVAALSSITATDGDYYYCKSENVLAVWDANEGSNGGWVQLNPDTNTRLGTTSTALSTGAATGLSANETGAKINLSIAEDNSTIPSNPGEVAHTATGSVTIKGTGAANVSQSSGVITIDVSEGVDTHYSIGTSSVSGLSSGQSGAKVTLDATGSATDTDVTIKSANSNLAVAENNGVITLTAADQSVEAVTAAFDSSGKFKVTVKDATDATGVASTEITPTITYGDSTGSNTTSNATFNSGTATLNVYTKAQTDAAISAAMATADALTYAGTVSSSDASTKLVGNAPVGTVYKASTAISSPVVADIGDLIIATLASGATEGEANSIEWDVIPSGDDQTITFTKDASTGQILISDGTNNGAAGIKVAAGTHIAATHALNGNVITTTVAQAADYTAQDVEGSTAGVTQTQGSDASFTAVTAIETDAYGNVVNGSIKTQQFTVKGGSKIDSVVEQVTHDSTGASVKTIVSGNASDTANGTFKVISDNLTITNGTNTGSTSTTNVKINLEWGTF